MANFSVGSRFLRYGAEVNQKSEEQLYASLQRGMQATADLAVALPLLANRRDGLIIQAIADFHRKDPSTGRRVYDGQDALLFVAALAENQRLLDDLQHVERQGKRDGARLTGQENTNAQIQR